jgi:hypothetical protein
MRIEKMQNGEGKRLIGESRPEKLAEECDHVTRITAKSIVTAKSRALMRA